MAEVLQCHNHEIDQIIRYQLESTGKMMRPRLVFLTASLAQHDPAVVRDVAVAVELIHIASLVHDDIIDRAMLRRGRESLNHRFGNHASVLTGDYFFATAFHLINRHGRQDIMENITETIRIMCAGEIQQLSMTFNVNVTEEEYYQKTYGKTACLFSSACKVGALASQLPEEVVCALESYGLNLGYAYQIIDDVLDFVSDSSLLGKPAASDLLEGNLTLPVIYALQQEKYGPWIKTVLSKRRLTSRQVERMIKVLIESKAIEQSLKSAEQHIARARTSLQHVPPGPVRMELENIAVYMMSEYYSKSCSADKPQGQGAVK